MKDEDYEYEYSTLAAKPVGAIEFQYAFSTSGSKSSNGGSKSDVDSKKNAEENYADAVSKFSIEYAAKLASSKDVEGVEETLWRLLEDNKTSVKMHNILSNYCFENKKFRESFELSNDAANIVPQIEIAAFFGMKYDKDSDEYKTKSKQKEELIDALTTRLKAALAIHAEENTDETKVQLETAKKELGKWTDLEKPTKTNIKLLKQEGKLYKAAKLMIKSLTSSTPNVLIFCKFNTRKKHGQSL